MHEIIYCGDPKNERLLCTALIRGLEASGCENPNCVAGWHEGAWRALRHAANFESWKRVSKAELFGALKDYHLLDALGTLAPEHAP